MENSNQVRSGLLGAWDSLTQFVDHTVNAIKEPVSIVQESSERVKAAQKAAIDNCELKIETSDLIAVDPARALTNQIADFVRRKEKQNPNVVHGICEFKVYDDEELDALKLDEYAAAGAHYEGNALADYHSDTDNIRIKSSANEEWVLNHETAHHMDLGHDKHGDDKIKQTVEEYKNVSWVGFTDEKHGETMVSQDDGVLYTQDFAREYGTTNHKEDWATGVERVLQDPLKECEGVGRKESSLWTHKASIICENDHISPSRKASFEAGEDYFHISKNRVEKILEREREKENSIRFRKSPTSDSFLAYRYGTGEKSKEIVDAVWSTLPSDFKPLNIRRIGTDREVMVSGHDKENNFVVYRMQRGFNVQGKAMYHVVENDLIGMPKGLGEISTSVPARYKNGYVYTFHSKDNKKTALVYYDLKTNRLYTLKNQTEFLEKHFSEVKRVYDKDGKLYALGVNHQGKNIVMNIKIDLRK